MREKCRSESFSGQADWSQANNDSSEETADNPTGNSEHWLQGSCGQSFSDLII